MADPSYRARLPMIDEAHEVGEAVLAVALPKFPRSLFPIILGYAIEDDVMPYLSFAANAIEKIVALYPLQEPRSGTGFILRVMSKKPRGLQKLYSCNIEDNTMGRLYDANSYGHCDEILSEAKSASALAHVNAQAHKFFDRTGDVLIDLTTEGRLCLSRISDKHMQLFDDRACYQKLHYAVFYQHGDSNCVVVVAECQAAEAEATKNVLLRYSFCKDSLSYRLLKKCPLPGAFYRGVSDMWGDLAYAERDNKEVEQPLYSSHGSNIFRIPESLGMLRDTIDGFWCFQKFNNRGIESEKNIVYTGGNRSISWKFATDPAMISRLPSLEGGGSSPRLIKSSSCLARARRQKQWVLQDIGITAFALGASMYSTVRLYADPTVMTTLEGLMLGVCSYAYLSWYKKKPKQKQVQSSL